MPEINPSPGFRPQQSVGENQASETNSRQLEEIDDSKQANTKAEVSTQQFEQLLNNQQRVTNVAQNETSNVFDPASDISANSPLQQPGQDIPI